MNKNLFIASVELICQPANYTTEALLRFPKIIVFKKLKEAGFAFVLTARGLKPLQFDKLTALSEVEGGFQHNH
jgi:hypothetical protein